MDVRLSDSFPKEAVRIEVDCEDWREAVRVSGQLLVDIGAAEDRYIDAIVDAVERLGPYIVLAPGIAISHARPEDGATAVGFSLARLAEPVEFGAKKNDPVDLMFAFASPDQDQHVSALSALADFIESSDHLERIRGAETVDELYSVIEEAEQ